MTRRESHSNDNKNQADIHGPVLQTYVPTSRGTALRGCLMWQSLCILSFTLGWFCNGSPVVCVFGIAGIWCGGLAFKALVASIAPGSRVCVFGQGISIGKKFLPWEKLRAVEYYTSHIHGDHGDSHSYYGWTFHDKSGAITVLQCERGPFEYLPPDELNKVLQARNLLVMKGRE